MIPREVIFLNGPPGSGKGANLDFVKRIRGLTKAVTMSSMLAPNAEAQAIIQEGGLVPDAIVGDALLTQAFHPDYTDKAGIIVDGFPRSEAQVRACVAAMRVISACALRACAHNSGVTLPAALMQTSCALRPCRNTRQVDAR